MSNSITIKWLILLTAFTAIVSSCNEKKDTNSVPDSYIVSMPACSCDSSWFPHASTPAPLEGVGSPFDTSSTTNCMFHQWSWQKFLYLTRPTPSGKALFQDSLIQIDATMTPVKPYNNVALVLEDTAQAGSGGSLHTNPSFGDGKPYMVYYSIYVNNTMMGASVAFKKAIAKDTAILTSAMFPVGALELKVSWVNVKSIPASQVSAYYVSDAYIKSKSGYEKVQVALLGIHVVGRVINHPEFIWATFEHQDMVPQYNWAKTTDSLDSPITSADDKILFSKGETTTLNGILWNSTTASPYTPYKVYALYKFGVPRLPLDSFMTGLSQDGFSNYANIESINGCVAANLKKEDVWSNYFYNGSIWVNMDGLDSTQQAQLLVSEGGSIGSGLSNSPVRGSLSVANSTMETYMQTFPPVGVTAAHSLDTATIANCMSCHSGKTFSPIKVNGQTVSSLSPLYVSHIFRSYLNNTQKLKESKVRGIVDFVERQKVLKKK